MMQARRSEEGFTYIAVLFAVALAGTVLAGTGVVWSTSIKRDKEEELLHIGNEIRNAIGAYYQKTPGTLKRYPPSLEALIKDNRQAATTRYLRRIYRDPFTGDTQWGVVKAPDGGVMGIYSTSEKRPMRKSFDSQDADFVGKSKYSDWRFIYLPSEPVR